MGFFPRQGFFVILNTRALTKHMGLDLKLRNSLTEVVKLRASLEALTRGFGIDPKTAFQIDLSLEEVFSNIVRHAFPDHKPHEILVQAEVAEGWMTIRVEDDGKEFNPLLFPAPDLNSPLEKRQPGRLGIHLVRSLMDRVSYARARGKNILLLRKKIIGESERHGDC